MKKKLIGLAIEKKYVCVFNHDMKTKAGYLSGTPDKVEVDVADL